MSQAFQAGMHAMESNAYPVAIRHFQSALGEDPEDPVTHAMISIALSQSGRRHAALVEARRASSLAPELPIAHVAEAYAHVLHDDPQAAEKSFSMALELDPQNRAARLGRCRLARHRRDAESLATSLADYQALAPNDPEGELLTAHLHLMRGELEKADIAARRGLGTDPDNPDGFTALGWVDARRGDARQARQMAISALNLAPEDRDAHLLLAHATIQQRPIIGYWQRFSLWLALGGEIRILAILIGAWIAYRVGVVLLDEGGFSTAAVLLQVGWLGLVLMTWIAGFQYRRLVERELERAELDPDY